MKLSILISVVVFIINVTTSLGQCGSACGVQIIACNYNPPNPGCPMGTASWGMAVSPATYSGAVLNNQGAVVAGVSFYYNGSGMFSNNILLLPGDYTINFSQLGGGGIVCGSLAFSIPGPSLEGFINVSIDSGETEYPANRCSSGSVTASFSMNGQNCLPQPTATLVHNGGTIPGVFQAPDQFFFDNVPNSDPITINVTAGPATGSTSAVFLGPCASGTGGGVSGTTPASAGCANGTITGTMPSNGPCGPGGMQIFALPDMTLVQSSNYTYTEVDGVTNFTANNIAPGDYEVKKTTDNGSGYTCMGSPTTVTVGVEDGELPFVANVQEVPSQGLCDNGKLLLQVSSPNPCFQGVYNYTVKNATTEEVVVSGSSANEVDGTVTIQGLAPTNYIIVLELSVLSESVASPQTFGPYSITVGDPATELCNGIDDDCDGDIDEDVDPENLNTYYIDADGDGFGDPNQPVQACSAPPGTSAVAGDCDDDDNQTGIFDFTQPCSATLDVVVNSIDNVGVWCEGAHVTVSLNSSACYSSWTLYSGSMQLMGYDGVWNADAGESVNIVVPVLLNNNLSHEFLGIIDGSETTCGASTMLSGVASPLGCDAQFVSSDVAAQTELNEPDGSVMITFEHSACQPNQLNVIRATNTITGQQFVNGNGGSNTAPNNQGIVNEIIGVSGLPAGDYVIDIDYLNNSCPITNFTTITIPYEPAVIVADFNGDGTVNQADSDLLHSHYGCIVAQNSDCAMFDLDGDGVIGYGDGLLFIGEFAGN